ncbi:ER degradation-enhancing alpha-mannosidase-like protein 2 [Quaeritorhiza haematococci]|nr:ER degradation-enhancing alpha-mannosidase-like protein 2 [Quaeritorhiza haematococci]
MESKLVRYRTKTKEMYYFGLTKYMEHAYPKDELKPLSCAGIDTIGNFSLTLIDALDTAAVMDDLDTFSNLIQLVTFIDFNKDVNVSVFETNIRVIGGLLSAHIIAAMNPEVRKVYDWSLLEKAVDMAQRLLPAFDTPTGLPYGTVNLINGVPEGEIPVVCTACAGTFSLEWTWLSLLTGDPIYQKTSRKSMRALWNARSKLGLFGSHINVQTGQWVHPECSIGGGVDSFYEYLLKTWIAFADEEEYHEMFVEAYAAIKKHMKKNLWHVDVHLETGETLFPYFHSLGSFWPGVKVLAGDVDEAVDELNAMSVLLRHTKFLPEAVDLRGGSLHYVSGKTGYPLRPEFIESMWKVYQVTSLRTSCGFANVEDVIELKLGDKMESFFLAETLKYLYLLFTPSSSYNSPSSSSTSPSHGLGTTFVFNTEAHPFPVWGSWRTDEELLELQAALTAEEDQLGEKERGGWLSMLWGNGADGSGRGVGGEEDEEAERVREWRDASRVSSRKAASSALTSGVGDGGMDESGGGEEQDTVQKGFEVGMCLYDAWEKAVQKKIVEWRVEKDGND